MNHTIALTPSTLRQLDDRIDLNVLKEIVSDDMALFRHLLIIFTEMAGPMFDRLVQGMRRADCRESEQASHALIGSTAMVGATALTQDLRQIEQLARQGNPRGFADQLPVIETRFRHMMGDVKAGLQALDG